MKISLNVAKLKSIVAGAASATTFAKIAQELISLAESRDFKISYCEAPNPNAMPLYDAVSKKLIGAHVTYRKNDMPNFIHEMTHASVLKSYQCDLINYYCGTTNTVPLEYGSTKIDGSYDNTVSALGVSLISRRKAWYRSDCERTLQGNLQGLMRVAESGNYVQSPEPYMSVDEKKRLKELKGNGDIRLLDFLEDMNERGLVVKSNKFLKASEINKTQIYMELTRRKNWIKDRINYGLNGMSGLGDVHFEYDTVVNQMLTQMHLWGYDSRYELFRAIDQVALEAYERRVSALEIQKLGGITRPVIAIPRNITF